MSVVGGVVYVSSVRVCVYGIPFLATPSSLVPVVRRPSVSSRIFDFLVDTSKLRPGGLFLRVFDRL